MMKLTALPRVLWIALFLLLGTACTEESAQPLRIGTNVWAGYEPLYLARHKGFLSDDVTMVELISSSSVLRAFKNGALEVAALTLDEVLVLKESGLDPRVILVLDVSHGGDVLLAQPGIHSIHELKGKRVGVEKTALGAYMLSRSLTFGSLVPSDIISVPVNIREQEAVFLGRQVDALITFAPVSTKLLEAGATVLFDSSQISSEIVDVLVVDGSFMEKYPQRIRDVIDGWYRALTFIRENPGEADTLFAPRLKVSPEQVEAVYKGLQHPDRVTNLAILTGQNITSIQSTTDRIMEIMIAAGLLAEPVNTTELLRGVDDLYAQGSR